MRILPLAALAALLLGCSHAPRPVATIHNAGPATRPMPAIPPPLRTEGLRAMVVWVSVDGLRPDYITRTTAAETPLLHAMLTRGAFSRQLMPSTPSLTFAAHTSQVTGVWPDRHGIPANGFVDRPTGKQYNFPDGGSLMLAEPIWQTAKRAGLRVGVIDWPMSQAQTGNLAADYFPAAYSDKLTDAARLGRLASVLRYDNGAAPISLAIGYVAGVDKAGHALGPDAPGINPVLIDTDQTLTRLHTAALATFRQRFHPERGDRLYFMVSADHGMGTVTHLVNPKLLLENLLPTGAKPVSSGSIMNLYLQTPDAAPAIVAALKQHPFLRAYTQADIPPRWHLTNPARTGDVYIVLAPGYTFSEKAKTLVAPRASDQTPRGMHADDPYAVPAMAAFLGVLVDSAAPVNLHGQDLGPVDCTRLHATVAHWLDIPPSPAADGPPVDLR